MALLATAQTVTEYAAHLTVTPSAKTGFPPGPSSIERVLTAIRSMHEAANPVVPETSGARKVLLASRCEQLALAHDSATTVHKATPALPAEIRRILAPMDRSSLTGMRDAVLVLLGHATAAQSSELAALDIDSGSKLRLVFPMSGLSLRSDLRTTGESRFFFYLDPIL
ncbi:hypothetical protein [Streptosporangium sp. NPDC004631]